MQTAQKRRSFERLSFSWKPCGMRWWAELDSNQRRQSQQIYSLPPLAAWVSARFLREELGVKAGRGLLQMDSL